MCFPDVYEIVTKSPIFLYEIFWIDHGIFTVDLGILIVEKSCKYGTKVSEKPKKVDILIKKRYNQTRKIIKDVRASDDYPETKVYK